jgi:uncharacterized membrane protein YfcA
LAKIKLFLFGDIFLPAFEFIAIVFLGSISAGLLGAMTGLGGGIVITPLLTLLLNVDMHFAIGSSLVAVIATSSGAAASYVKQGFTNIRIGMFLEVATTCGALCAALLSGLVPVAALSIIFGLVLLFSAYKASVPRQEHGLENKPDRLAQLLNLNGTFPVQSGSDQIDSDQPYKVINVIGGFVLMYIAGILSGLLGIGSGVVKVLAMDEMMRIPFKVSTTTSNFMIGVTACASAGIYLSKGYINPLISMPVVFGVLIGSNLGAKILAKANVVVLRKVFAIVIAIASMQMIWKGISGGI